MSPCRDPFVELSEGLPAASKFMVAASHSVFFGDRLLSYAAQLLGTYLGRRGSATCAGLSSKPTISSMPSVQAAGGYCTAVEGVYYQKAAGFGQNFEVCQQFRIYKQGRPPPNCRARPPGRVITQSRPTVQAPTRAPSQEGGRPTLCSAGQRTPRTSPTSPPPGGRWHYSRQCQSPSTQRRGCREPGGSPF